ncbi:MAG: Diacylglycerol kinase catalytic region [uncultured Thiotrichaceae bacterium]|uniref:Diacylglycerol kinase catalytic region n=1 Tax=uncultured Thiotrichaceae bacterium TaxID=298394 RepID=A0A6S6SMQ0_9GAMM|nr:MAG: Diacylglycerol kinase catalytic region [uncultured Thiotrichaceae bacterium]
MLSDRASRNLLKIGFFEEMKTPFDQLQAKVPAFINPDSGTAEQVLPLLEEDSRLEVYALEPVALATKIEEAVRCNVARVIVSGGDGTIALAASKVAQSETELAIVPGGTLNHFSSRLGIPEDTSAAIDLAVSGSTEAVGVGYVNDHLFINTSSVGAYVHFVRTRNQLQSDMGYHSASIIAGLRRLIRFRSSRVILDQIKIRSPLVFVGVEERELSFPHLGQYQDEGREGLHLIAVKSRSRFDTLKIAINAILRGIDPLDKAEKVENNVLDSLQLDFPQKSSKLYVAADGELVKLESPLRYRYARNELAVVTQKSQ